MTSLQTLPKPSLGLRTTGLHSALGTSVAFLGLSRFDLFIQRTPFAFLLLAESSRLALGILDPQSPLDTQAGDAQCLSAVCALRTEADSSLVTMW